MGMIQLDPPIPIYVIGKGTGIAHFLIDYSPEHQLYWVTFMDDTGECWTVSNPGIRAQNNISLGRVPNAT